MTRQDAEKLAIKLGCCTWDQGNDGFGGEWEPHEKAVNILMGYVVAPPNCPGCESDNAPHLTSCNKPVGKTLNFDPAENMKAKQ